jgi:hypothetical protein
MLVGTLILAASGAVTTGLVELDVLWRNLAIAALLGALGVGVGALVRNQTVAVTALLIIGLFLEPTLSTLVPDVARFGPRSGHPPASSASSTPRISCSRPDSRWRSRSAGRAHCSRQPPRAYAAAISSEPRQDTSKARKKR